LKYTKKSSWLIGGSDISVSWVWTTD
jgi:hypothetical protein